MKIVAKISNDRILVEMTKDEFAMICGFTYDIRYTLETKNNIDIGLEDNVSEMFSFVNYMEDSGDKIAQTQATLRAVADMLSTPKQHAEFMAKKIKKLKGTKEEDEG